MGETRSELLANILDRDRLLRVKQQGHFATRFDGEEEEESFFTLVEDAVFGPFNNST